MFATNAAAAYAKVSNSVLGPRSVEQKVFQQVTGLLNAANASTNISTAQIAEAVHKNSQLWTILATDAASEENALPPALRAQIISLAIFSQKTGRAVLRKESKLDELIEVNRAIMAGLDGDAGTQQPVTRIQ